jgi:hypothetical protein
VAVGDVAATDGNPTPPTLKLPDEKQTPTADPTEGTSMRKVQMPVEKEPVQPPNAVPDDTPAPAKTGPPSN